MVIEWNLPLKQLIIILYEINSRDIKFTQNGTDCSFSKIEYDISTVSILNIQLQVAALALLLVLEARCAHFVIAHFNY